MYDVPGADHSIEGDPIAMLRRAIRACSGLDLVCAPVIFEPRQNVRRVQAKRDHLDLVALWRRAQEGPALETCRPRAMFAFPKGDDGFVVFVDGVMQLGPITFD